MNAKSKDLMRKPRMNPAVVYAAPLSVLERSLSSVRTGEWGWKGTNRAAQQDTMDSNRSKEWMFEYTRKDQQMINQIQLSNCLLSKRTRKTAVIVKLCTHWHLTSEYLFFNCPSLSLVFRLPFAVYIVIGICVSHWMDCSLSTWKTADVQYKEVIYRVLL